MEIPCWYIQADTGGTFTDCIAVSPEGENIRIKVLSNSTLRGVITQKTGSGRYRFQHQWPWVEGIFKGYRFSLLENTDIQTLVEDAISDEPGFGQLQLHHDLDFKYPAAFEVGAGEEAPVLAVRLATRTPLGQPLPPLKMRLGTTKGTNALLERKGARVTLCITRGFVDLPVIGTQQRPNLFQLDIPPAEALYEHVVEIDARMDAEGQVIHALSEQDIQQVLDAAAHADAIAIALLHSYRNTAHEALLTEHLQSAGHGYISSSAALSPSVKLLPRAQTAVVNAYLSPVLNRYLRSIQQSLGEADLHVMTSAGGLVRMEDYRPKDSLLSGPAGGVTGAAFIAQKIGFQRIITLDMGGTSTDCARIDGQYDYRFITRVGHAEMFSPTLDIETVAAGGGSICSFDGRKLKVGPESAGASPGPACYGAGGPLTITDVNLLLGKLLPDAMGIPISESAARAALDDIRNEIKSISGQEWNETDLLRAFEQIADERMAGAIRKISVTRGFNPADYALLAFGGAGGLHACHIAELLDMREVIIPFDAGLLSARGIGEASMERFAEMQILKPLHVIHADIPRMMRTLEEQAMRNLAREGFEPSAMRIARRILRLRFSGQESSLELDWDVFINAEAAFEQLYRRLFAYFPQGKIIEVESARVIAASTTRSRIFRPEKISSGNPLEAVPTSHAVWWERLAPGTVLDGPMVVLHPHHTAFVAPGWRLEMHAGLEAVLRRVEAKERREALGEAAALELFTHRFSAIAEEMGAQLQRTAFSVNIKERLDFSCALLDVEGELLVNAPHIPVHLGSLGICARLILEKFSLGPGDVVMTNHPRYGGSHLPDVTLLSAVFDDEGQLLGYVINRAHHAEIGGKTPGSMPPDARTLAEEGVVIPPVYLFKEGVAQWEMVEQLFTQAPYPTRAPAENIADLNAAVASLQTGIRALQYMARKYGSHTVRHYMSALKNLAADALEEVLSRQEEGHFEAVEYLDDGSPLSVQISLQSGKMVISFEGTGATHPFNLNANMAIVYSVVLYVLRLLIRREIPLNEGLLRHVRIVLPEGTLLMPKFEDDGQFCPAVVGGNTEVSQRLTDALLKALGLAACSQGTMNNFLFGDDRFGYYETIGGGAGAGEGFAGRSAVHQHMTNTRITDPEELELRYPVRLRQFGIRRGSGGSGRWSGGDGIIREFEFLKPVKITLLTQHRREAPYGMNGGQAGAPGQQFLIREDGTEVPLEGITSLSVQAGQRIRMETPGGGGWGHREV